MLLKDVVASTVLNPEPLNALPADAQVTPVPRDQLENVTPAGGVVQVATGVAGQVMEVPPPTVTVVCDIAFKLLQVNISMTNKRHNLIIPPR